MKEVFVLDKKEKVTNYISIMCIIAIFFIIVVSLYKQVDDPFGAIIILAIVWSFIIFQAIILNAIQIVITDSAIIQKYVLRTRTFLFSDIEQVDVKVVRGFKYLAITSNNQVRRIHHIDKLEREKDLLLILEKKIGKKINKVF